MTSDQVWWEYRQICAHNHEKATGKPFKDSEDAAIHGNSEAIVDSEFDNYVGGL